MNIAVAFIVYGVLVYELIVGYAVTRSATRSRRVLRSDEPRKYWFYLAFQFVFATAILLYGFGVFG